MQQEEVYRREDYWRAFLSCEQEACQFNRGHRDFMPGDDAPDSEDEVFYEEDDTEDEEMEGRASSRRWQLRRGRGHGRYNGCVIGRRDG
jgi:hypothetical protein